MASKILLYFFIYFMAGELLLILIGFRLSLVYLYLSFIIFCYDANSPMLKSLIFIG